MSIPYTAFPNRLRQQLKAGERLIGCWLSLGSPITTEVVGVAGFDWILLDAFDRPGGQRWRDHAARLAEKFRATFWVDGPYGPQPALALGLACAAVTSFAMAKPGSEVNTS